MSFAGFVYDMIRRSKENRDLLNLRRERAKMNKEASGTSTSIPEISLEEFEKYQKINKELKEREKEEQQHLSKLTLKIAICILITLFIIIGLLKLFVL